MNTIAIIGGTGPQGQGLALRFAMAGQRVAIGSRNAERSDEIARNLTIKLPSDAGEIWVWQILMQ